MLTPARVRPSAPALALAAVLAVLLSSLVAGVAHAAETGSFTLRLQGLVGADTTRVSGACFRVFGYENGNPGTTVREQVCELDDGVLDLTGLPVTADRRYLVQEVGAPSSVLREDGTRAELQLGRVEPFDVAVGEDRVVLHHPAGSVEVRNVGATSEQDPSPLQDSLACFYVERETVLGQLGERRGPFCGDTLTDLEPDHYRFTTNPFSDHLGGTTRVYVAAQVLTRVEVEAPLAPDFRVHLVDRAGQPLLSGCFEVLAVDVPG